MFQNCIICSRLFEVQGLRRTCSDKCKAIYSHKRATGQICAFELCDRPTSGGFRFCSEACRKKDVVRRYRQKKRAGKEASL